MLIERTEKTLRLIDAQKYIKKTYQLDVTVTRIRAWISTGLVSHSGQRIVLRAHKKFGHWFTTDRAVDEFVLEQGR